MLTAAIGFIIAFVLIFLRVPVAIALAVIGFAGFAYVNGMTPALSMITLITSGSTMSYPLVVIPLFILMGNFVAGGGISAQLYRAAQVFIGHWRGGLALATIISCGGFAAVCGSSVATAVTMGKVSIPSMRKYGYSDSLSTATVAAGGTLGILIPPSVIMVVYGVQTETHIGKLFAAGLLPGLIGVIGYSLAVRWSVYRRPESAPPAERSDAKEKIDAIKDVWPVVALFVLVLGGIYSGLFTATEAGGIGAVGALVFAVFRGMTLKSFFGILKDSVQTTAVLFALILGATIFGEFINLTGADRAVLSLVSNSSFPPWLVILIIMMIYILLGCVLDSLAMILLTLPMFFPIVTGLGYDPVWFGIFVVMLVELGLITPPIGMNLFILRSVAPDVRLGTIIRGILPFIVSDIGRILLIAFFPIVALLLPNLFF
ncbi:tripartite ATP-independent transporter DctM subunit [Mesorhizobium sp. J18]|uniref:TRAP transporter large permease n=1 Tax=Mesorhizobium sp. J18 TaxID=935263 RepID=UPI00119B0731|nr:TRAP transporter large permease [Mesorhizobium sp. J18]TWG92798.1 tripartite ATP-independent transporter DctM subunit [Mesorhizobium sp. J18]